MSEIKLRYFKAIRQNTAELGAPMVSQDRGERSRRLRAFDPGLSPPLTFCAVPRDRDRDSEGARDRLLGCATSAYGLTGSCSSLSPGGCELGLPAARVVARNCFGDPPAGQGTLLTTEHSPSCGPWGPSLPLTPTAGSECWACLPSRVPESLRYEGLGLPALCGAPRRVCVDRSGPFLS